MTAHRHVCVHAHFHQPPRENPWLGEVEREDGALPFHDWNEKVAEEILGPALLGRDASSESLLRLVSFDFGPALLSWLERRRPSLYRRVIEADAESARPDGLGNAVAQPYFHAILPLATRRDKETLVRWGIADFRARYGRKPLGLWLPETAVDDETLDVLADEKIAFTILDPAQAADIRPVGGRWTAAGEKTLDPTTPYRWRSPKDPSRALAIFFYHRNLSRGAASGQALADAAGLARAVANRLLPGDAAQLVHIASDGESYGRQPQAGQTLSSAFSLLEEAGVSPINHSRFLALFPPPREVRIRERSSWSREHDLGRWERDRGALDDLARRLDAFYEREASRFFDDPWAARDAAVELWLDRSGDARRGFLAERAKRRLEDDEQARALRLLVMQRERLAMFTSCGRAVDDVSGAEPAQILRRAARAVDLARSLGEDASIDADAARRDAAASSRVGLDRAAAHAAILDHLGLWPARLPEALEVELGPAARAEKRGLAGRDRTLSARAARVRRRETLESAEWSVVVHRADRLDFACWLVPKERAAEASALGGELSRLDDDAFRAGLDARFGPSRFGLDAVLADDRIELVRALAPEGGLGAERSAYLRRWTETVSAARRGGRDDDAVLELLRGATDRGFRPEHLPWARELEDELHARLEEILAPGGAGRISRALRWLDALLNAGLLAGTRRLLDFQRRWSGKLAGSGPSAEKDACRALGERLESPQFVLEE